MEQNKYKKAERKINVKEILPRSLSWSVIIIRPSGANTNPEASSPAALLCFMSFIFLPAVQQDILVIRQTDV